MAPKSRSQVRPLSSLMAVLLLFSAFGSIQLSGWAAPPAVVQDDAASPAADDEDRVDLAAIVLDAADLPDGSRLISEQYIPVEEIIQIVAGGDQSLTRELEESGLLGFYESEYSLPGSQLTVRSYAEEYEDEQGAATGFGILEDETGSYSGGDVEDTDVPGVDGDDEEITTVDFDTGGGFRFQSIDATIRLGRIVAGAAVENADGSDGADEPDLDMASDLIVIVAERIEAVVSGDSVAGRDLALPPALLRPTAAEPIVIEGHLAPSEVLPEVLDEVRDSVEGAFARTVGVRFKSANTAPPVLFVHMFLAAFDDAESAEQALYALDDLTLPSLLPPPTDSLRQQATTAAIPDVDAFAESWRAFLPGGPIDSARLGFVLESRLVIVEVAGGANLNAAHDAAVLIAELQRDCLLAGDRCAEPLPVDEIQDLALIDGEPISAVEDADPDRQATFDAVWDEINNDYLYRTGRQYALFPNYHELDWALFA